MNPLYRICDPCRLNHCAELRRREAKLKKFVGHAEAAAAVYGDKPPPGFRDATPDELGKLGLDHDTMENLKNPKTGETTNFRARMYVNETTGERVIAFRGTDNGEDWGQNFRQGVGMPAAYYTRAQYIAAQVEDSPGGGDVTFVGHSLGGGLASAAARASGNPATTVNAAGLNPLTVLRGDEWHFGAPIDSVHVRGDPLTSVQSVLPVPAAASSEDWPLDPPDGYGRKVLSQIGHGQIKDAAKALTLGLHSADTAVTSVKQELARTRHEIVENKCP